MISTSLFNYVNPNVDPNLICCICQTPFNEPVTTRSCSHTFCHGCILQAISVSAQCPIDRSPLEADLLVQADPIIRHLVDELVVECPNREEGCRCTAQRQLIGAHLKRDCEFVPVVCEVEGCEKMRRRRKDVGNGCVHELVADTSDETIASSSNATCDFCGDSVVHSERDQHVGSCPEAIIPCAQSVHGCPWTGRRVLLEAHALSCPYESIKAFFVINSAQLSKLSEENDMLRHKIDGMEGIIRTMQRELQIVRAVLGPWYRPEGDRPSVSHDPSFPREQLLSDMEAFSAAGSRSGDFLSAVISNTPSYPHSSVSAASPPVIPPSTSSSASSLADYFPPEDPSIAARPSGVRVHHNLPSFSAHHIPDHSGVNPPNANRSSPVAPLNLSTSLEGTLLSLRESLVTLSAALESQGRRQELALTTEGLRVNEEVGSLKAVVHGLRMQVHAIMMDRNAQVTGRLPFSGSGSGAVVPGLGSDEGWPEAMSSHGHSMPGAGVAGFPLVPLPPAPGRFGHHQYYPAQPAASITKL